jgi:hypothetical protein
MGATARESDRRVGERMVVDEVAWLGRKAEELLTAYEQERPTDRLRTFEAVERVWETVVRPRLPEFRTLQQHWEGREPPPEDSVWRAHWTVPDQFG